MFLDRLSALMQEKGLNKMQLSKQSGIPYTTIDGLYKKGYEHVQLSTLEKLSAFFGVSIDYLCRSDEEIEEQRRIASLFRPARLRKVPLVGRVACGEPILADEHIEQYVDAEDSQADLALTATGDSMVGARIYDGDTVFIHEQPEVENGEIAVVLIGDEATLKRVRYDEEHNEISLYPENPNYKTMRFSGEELNSIRILGKVVAVQFRPR